MDVIANMLTIIRNGQHAKKRTVSVPSSKIKMAIAKILKERGYVEDIKEEANGAKKEIKIALKYAGDTGVIAGIKRISTPGLRVYADVDKMPKVLGGLGIAIVSTSKGVMTDGEARVKRLGGEVLAYVW